MKELSRQPQCWAAGTWIELQEGELTATILRFENGSQYGIKNGRISYLEIMSSAGTEIRYDRGWDYLGAEHKKETQAFYENIIKEYN